MRTIFRRPLLLAVPAGAALALASASPAQADVCPSPMVNMTRNTSTVQVDAIARLHVIWWGWGSRSAPLTTYNEARAVFEGQGATSFSIGDTRWMNTISQYPGYQWAGGTLSSQWVVPSSQPNLVIEETALENNLPTGLVTPAIAATEVEWAKSTLQSRGESIANTDAFALMLPPGTWINAAGYNSHQADGTLWFEVAYPAGTPNPAPDGADGQMEAAIQHEMAELFTDPTGSTGTGWTSTNSTGTCQVGDFCHNNYFFVQTQPLFNNRYSANGACSGGIGNCSQIQVQQLWSNETSGCVYGRTEAAVEFGVGWDGKLWWGGVQADTQNDVQWTPGWGTWGSAPGGSGTLIGKPAVTSWGPWRVEAFVLDSAGNMEHGYSDDGARDGYWEVFSNNLAGSYYFDTSSEISQPDAASSGAGNTEAFAFMRSSTGGATILAATTYDNAGWSGFAPVTPLYSAPKSKISAAAFMASGVGSTVPANERTFLLSYIDTNDVLWIGTLDETGHAGANLGSPVWQEYGVTNMFTPQDLDIAISSPGRYDILIRDTSGNVWDCFSANGGLSAPSCGNFGHPAGVTINGTPGAVGMGDGRLLVSAQGSDRTGYSYFVDQSQWTGWVHSGGGFNGSIDVASW
jgi:hypothetical protein